MDSLAPEATGATGRSERGDLHLSDSTDTGITVGEMPAEDQSISTDPDTTAAFIGRALCGPVNHPVTVASFSEFTRRFGGHWRLSSLGPAVDQFFAHGGRRAIIVRVANGARGARLTLPAGNAGLTLVAVNPGAGETFRASVDYDGIDGRPGADGTRFNLTVQRLSPRTRLVDDQEIFRGVTCEEDSENNVRDRLLTSRLVRVAGSLPAERPEATRSDGADRAVSYVLAAEPGTDGQPLTDYDLIGSAQDYTGLFALQGAAHFSFLYAPPMGGGRDPGPAFLMAAERYCQRRGAMLIVDPPAACGSFAELDLALRRDGFRSPHLMTYFPRVSDRRRPEDGTVPAGGALAGILARNDAAGHVWMSPADGAALLRDLRPAVELDDKEAAALHRHGVQTLRRGDDRRVRLTGDVTFTGSVFGGARRLGTERLVQFVLHRIERSTRWVLFRRSERVLWQSVERRVGEFMHGLEAAGAFEGRGTGAWFVRCNSSTNTAAQQGRPSVGLILGFRPAGESEMRVWSLVQEPGGARLSPAAFTGISAAAG